MLDVESDALLAAGDRRVAAHDHVAGLRERERHHRERDARDAQAQSAERGREHDRAEQHDSHGGHEGELRVAQHDAQAVRPDREVERVAEREQTGDAEQQVVAEGESREDHREGEQLQGAGRVGRTGQDAGQAQVEHRQECEDQDERATDDPRGRASGADAVDEGHDALLPRSPVGRTSRTTAKSTTTMKSPVPPR